VAGFAVQGGDGEGAVAGVVGAGVGDEEVGAADFEGEVAPEAADFVGGEFGFVGAGEDAAAAAAFVLGGFVVGVHGGFGEFVDAAADGAGFDDFGPAVGDVPGVDFFEDGVDVFAAVIGVAEVGAGAEFGHEEGAALGGGAVGGEAALFFDVGEEGAVGAVFVEVAVVHDEVEGGGGEEGGVVVGVGDGEHGAELFEDVAGGGEHLGDAGAGGVEVAGFGDAFVAELEDEGVGVGEGVVAAPGGAGEGGGDFGVIGGGGGVVFFDEGVDGVDGDDGHEAVAFAIGGGLGAADGVDAEGAEVVGGFRGGGAAGGAFDEEGFVVEVELAGAGFDKGGGGGKG